MKTRTLIVIRVLLVAIFFAAKSNFVQASFNSGLPTSNDENNYGYGMMGGYGYGMMGGYGYGMMGGYYDEDDFCFNIDDNTPSYEWLYAHLNVEDQALVDAKYIDLVSAVDFSKMTLDEQQTAIDDIKVALVTFIEDSGFTLTPFRP